MIYSQKMRNLLGLYKGLIKTYFESTYHSIIHFPVEFPIEKSEAGENLNRQRMEYDKRIISFLEDLVLKHYIIILLPGARPKKWKRSCIYQLKPLMSIEAAIERAKFILGAATCKSRGI